LVLNFDGHLEAWHLLFQLLPLNSVNYVVLRGISSSAVFLYNLMDRRSQESEDGRRLVAGLMELSYPTSTTGLS
jgi:hypothetical protein